MPTGITRRTTRTAGTAGEIRPLCHLLPQRPPLDGYAVRSDGTLPATFQETLEQFDVERFAEDCREMGVEYVNFTSYHGHMYVLWPLPSRR